MPKCWIWLRRSTDKQELSIEDQRKSCHEFVALKGWEIAREFEPVKGWGSGLTIDQDASFKEMVHLAEQQNHGAKYLVVYDVSRFGRLKSEEKIYWEQHLKKRGGIEIVYVKDDFKNDGSIGDIITRVVKHDEAHQFSLKLSALTLRGAKSHAALGHSTGGKPPYGYDRLLLDEMGNPLRVLAPGEQKTELHRVIWTPCAEEVPTVKMIFESYVKGVGFNLIVKDLNSRQVPPPRGRHWSKAIISYMLRNRSYLGERTYNKRSYKSYRRGEKGSLYNPESEWIKKTEAHEPIIDRDLFDRVQSKLQARNAGTGQMRGIGKGRPYNSAYLLTGVAICGTCGYKLIGWPKKGNGHSYHTYTCGGYQRIGPSICSSFNVLREELEAHALQAIREQLADNNWKDEVRKIIEMLVNDQCGAIAEKDILNLRHQVETTQEQIENLVRAIQGGAYSTTLRDTLEKLEIRKNSLLKELLEAEARASASTEVESIVEEATNIADNFDDLWNNCSSNEEKKAFMRIFLQQVNVTRQDSTLATDIWLYKIPMPPKNEPARATFYGIPGLDNYGLSSLRG